MVVTVEFTEEVDAEFARWMAARAGAEVPPVVPRAPTIASPEPTPSSKPSPFASFGEEAAPVGVAARSDSGRWLDTHLLTILAAAAALLALRHPAAWLVVCATAAIVLVAAQSARGRAATKGSADVVVVPARATGRLLLGCVNPLNWLKVLLGACASLTVGALTGAVIGAARWVAIEGPEGALAAARSGAWAHAPTYGAVFVCYLLLSGIGRTHERRALALYRRTRSLPEVALVGMTVVLVAASLALALAGPQSDVGFVRGSDGLGWVPPGLRTVADGLRDDIVDAELDGVTRCLSGDQSGLWTYGYTVGNALDELDVATLTADPARAPDQRALAAAALAVHNHLAPWVETVKVTVGSQVVLMIDRRGLPTDEPLTDANELRAHAIGGPEWLSTVAPTIDTGGVLTCSVRTPL